MTITRGQRSGLAIIAFLLFMIWLAVEEPFFKKRTPATSPSVGAPPIYYRPGEPQKGATPTACRSSSGEPVYYGPGEVQRACADYYPPVKAQGASPTTATGKPARRRPRSFGVTEGSVVRLYSELRDVYVGTDKNALDALYDLARVGDDYGIGLLILSRRIALVKNGTSARVLDIGFFRHEVRILEGDHAGLRGWVRKEVVRR
jgi:hypothetical protein